MQGIIALLDPPHTQQVLDLWAELDQRLGLRGVQVFPYPHVSFHILDGYDPVMIREKLSQEVAHLRPFTIHTAGLGIFMTPAPVLYIPVVRGPALERVHRLVWKAFPVKEENAGYYAPEMWVPHITLAVGDLTHDNLPEVIAWLAGRDFHWEIRLNGLSLAVEVGEKYEIQCGCRFEGKKT